MLPPQPRSGQVYEHLLGLILSGELAPGTSLREADLSTRLGVSRTPIREALGRLAEYGVVRARPNHGAEVRRLGPEELAQIHQLREALEGMSATLACGRLTAEDFRRLDALAEASRSGGAPGDLDAYDVGLHGLVAERAGNPILAREIRRLHDLTRLIRARADRPLPGDRAAGPEEFRRACWARHAEIVEALRAHDAPGCREAMVRHVREACAYKVRLMPEAGPIDPTHPHSRKRQPS